MSPIPPVPPSNNTGLTADAVERSVYGERDLRRCCAVAVATGRTPASENPPAVTAIGERLDEVRDARTFDVSTEERPEGRHAAAPGRGRLRGLGTRPRRRGVDEVVDEGSVGRRSHGQRLCVPEGAYETSPPRRLPSPKAVIVYATAPCG